MEKVLDLWHASGIYNITGGQAIMMVIGLVLLFLAIRKNFEPLLLVPIGFGGLLANIPEAGLAYSAVENAVHFAKPELLQALAGVVGTSADPQAILHAYHESNASTHAAATLIANDAGYSNGMLYNFYSVAIASGVAPLLIFMGVGAMTDFGPLLANPKTLFLGAAAQFGIFATVLGAVGMSSMGIMDFTIQDAAAIGIIGGADGPTERKIAMHQLRHVSKTEKIFFPIVLLILVAMLLPDAAPLLGMFCFGNLMRECGVVDRLSDTAQNALINIVTIFLGLSVGSKLSADKFLDLQTLGILVLGIVAFGIGTAAGVLMAKLMNKLAGGNSINPLIGSAGVSAVPMAARVSNKLGLEANPQNFLLMHAMGPNVAGVIGSAVAAGVMIKFVG